MADLLGQAFAAVATNFEQAKSTCTNPEIFTNRGKASVKPGKKITRVPFTVSRLMEFCNKRELENQTAHDHREWPLVILKELVDNALDACEEAEIPPVVSIAVDGDTIVIEDNGPGIPSETIDGVLDYNIRVSSREAYVSPTRGAQGNALKTILPMEYVLGRRGEDACGKTLVEARGVAHRIEFSVDHIRLEPKIIRTTEPSSVVIGTRITVKLPKVDYGHYKSDIIEGCKERFLELAESYAWINPHLGLRVSWGSDVKVDAKASNPTWPKWLPCWPTSPHWYDESRFRRYMAAHIANREKTTVREFVSEFRGLSSTVKQKAILAEIGASHVSLYDFFGRCKANGENIAKLLAALKEHSKPVHPRQLGVIGKDHFYRLMESAGGDPKTFTYNRAFDETDDGVPYVSEFAFGVHRDGLIAGRGPRRKEITGVNWSPGIKNPFRELGRGGAGMETILSDVRANISQPVIVALHLACPRVAYTDRGKSAIVVEGKAERYDHDED
jgi:Histidine kinase-, DNA gyrase B-, and HSP90-like ATPase